MNSAVFEVPATVPGREAVLQQVPGVSVHARFSGLHYAELIRTYMRFVFRRKHGATLFILITADLLTLVRALVSDAGNGWMIFFIATGICGFLGFAAYAQERLRMLPLIRYARMIGKETSMNYVMYYDDDHVAFEQVSEHHEYHWRGLHGYIEFRGNIFLVNRHRQLVTCISPEMMSKEEFDLFRKFIPTKISRIR